MIVWAPERFGKGKQVDELVQLMDLGPTIIEWAGIEVPDDWEAISLSAALEQREDWKGREYVYCEQARDAVLTGCEFMTMVRSQHHKLVHFLRSPSGPSVVFSTSRSGQQTLSDEASTGSNGLSGGITRKGSKYRWAESTRETLSIPPRDP